MKKITVCSTCGSSNVMVDAWVHANDPDDVRTFDDTFCQDCDCGCKTIEVEVPDDFDETGDVYDLEGLK